MTNPNSGLHHPTAALILDLSLGKAVGEEMVEARAEEVRETSLSTMGRATPRLGQGFHPVLVIRLATVAVLMRKGEAQILITQPMSAVCA